MADRPSAIPGRDRGRNGRGVLRAVSTRGDGRAGGASCCPGVGRGPGASSAAHGQRFTHPAEGVVRPTVVGHTYLACRHHSYPRPHERHPGRVLAVSRDRSGSPLDATRYRFRTPEAGSLCEPWDLSTFPAPDAAPERFRLLFFSCAGGMGGSYEGIGQRRGPPADCHSQSPAASGVVVRAGCGGGERRPHLLGSPYMAGRQCGPAQ